MAGETKITIIGNMVADPEVRYTQNGNAVASFRVASTPTKFNKDSNEWENGDAVFLTCNVWRQYAENVGESLTKGMRVIVTGNLKQRSYETKEGEKRTVFEIEVDEVGPALRYGTATFNKAEYGSGNGNRKAAARKEETAPPVDDDDAPF